MRLAALLLLVCDAALADVVSERQGITVDVDQIDSSSHGTTCIFHAHNASRAEVGQFVLGWTLRLPFVRYVGPSPKLKVDLALQAGPQGWAFEEGAGTAFSMTLSSRSPETAVAPGQDLSFRLDLLPESERIRCAEIPWFARTAPKRRATPSEFPQTALALVLREVFTVPGPDAGKTFEAEVELRNVGEADSIVSVGMRLGRSMYPDRFRLVATGSDGKPVDLYLQEPAAAGRVDPMEVSLPRRAAYVVRGVWFPSEPLRSGTYEVSAVFEGRNAGLIDTRGDRSWTGKVESAPVRVTIPR